jgi:hypothetical protein
MKIPKSLKIAGKTYRVKWDNGRIQERGLIGECDYSSCTIILSKNDRHSVQTKESIEQVFLHELWHVIWDALGEKKFKGDERLADSFTCLLHQALNSGKGELKV